VKAAITSSERKGVLSAVRFPGLRMGPTERPVWNYWLNNYLLGENRPHSTCCLNNDVTNLPAALQAEFMSIWIDNSLIEPGRSKCSRPRWT